MAAHALMLFTDRIFLSRLGAEGLAIGFPAGITAYFCQCLFTAMAGYAATFAAQHSGAGEARACGPSVLPALWLAVAAGAVNAAAVPLLPALFSLQGLEAGLRDELATLTGWYMGAALPTTVLAGVNGFFAGTGRTHVVLILTCASVALNAVLNAGLIFGLGGMPRLGIVGSGIGTCATGWTMGAVALLLFWSPANRRTYGTWPRGWARWCDAARIAHYCRFAGPQGVRTIIEIGAWEGFTLTVLSLGVAPAAANSIVINWNLLTFIPMVGLGQAIAVAVGNAIGAGRIDLARAATRRGLGLELVYALVVGVGVLVFSDHLIAAFMGEATAGRAVDPYVVTALAHSLLVIAALWGIGDAVNLAYSGGLNGAGDTRWQMLATLGCAVVLLALPLTAVVLIAPDQWQRIGLAPVVAAWIATLLFVSGMAALMAWRFHRGAWQGMSVRRDGG